MTDQILENVKDKFNVSLIHKFLTDATIPPRISFHSFELQQKYRQNKVEFWLFSCNYSCGYRHLLFALYPDFFF